MTYDPRFYRDAYGTGENILSMASGSIAEPVSGVAALLAAAQGYGARGARDAIREKMTYQPRSSAGVEQAQMLARLVQGVMESAPVRAWQRGVDIAGRYSPAAGAALQTVPTAIGVVAGYKPTMAQGRAASMLAEQMQKRMVQNAMAPRTLHPQAGVISIGDTPKRVMGDIAKKAYELGVKHRRAMLEDPSLTLMDVIYASDDADRALSDIIYKRGYELSSAAYES